MKSFILSIAAFVSGFVPGTFLSFSSVLNNKSEVLMDRLPYFLLTFVAYALLGLIFGYLMPDKIMPVTIQLSVYGVFLLFMYAAQEPKTIIPSIVFGAITLGASYTGALLGSKYKYKLKKKS